MGTRRLIVLGAAFGAFLLTVSVASLAVWRDATLSESRITGLYTAFSSAEKALGSIRSDVYLVGILTRDFVLDNPPEISDRVDPTGIESRMQRIRADLNEQFQILDNFGASAEEKAAIKELREGVDAYWKPAVNILNWTPQQIREQRGQFLSRRGRRREQIDQLTVATSALMVDRFRRTQASVESAHQEFRLSLATTAILAILLGFTISGVTLFRMNRLEKRSEASEAELRLLSGQIRVAQEQERRFLSRELHDEVGQMLTGLRMELAAMARPSADGSADLSARITHAKGTVEQTLRLIRNIAMLLRPSMLDDLGLTPAITWLAKEVSRTSGIQIQPEVDPVLDSLPERYRTCLYRVVQEALTNISRHSSAAKAEVSLKTTGEWVVGVISDDGHGFESSAPPREGIGLLGMKERVRELGGSLHVLSKPGQGTRVELRLPIPTTAEVTHDSHPDRGRSRDRSDRVETSA